VVNAMYQRQRQVLTATGVLRRPLQANLHCSTPRLRQQAQPPMSSHTDDRRVALLLSRAAAYRSKAARLEAEAAAVRATPTPSCTQWRHPMRRWLPRRSRA